MKKVLITGASGFIGHYLTEEFLKDNEVICMLRPHTRSIPRLEHLKDKISIIYHDIKNPFDYKLIEKLADVKLILHTAGNPSSEDCTKDPLSAIYDNIVGTCNLLNFSKNINLERFVYYSAGECFGPTTDNKESLETDMYKCYTIYSASKASGSELCTAFSHTFKIPVSIIHVTNTFGKRSQINRFPIKVITKILKNESIDIHIGENDTMSSRRWLSCEELVSQTKFIIKNQKNMCEKWNSSGTKILTNLEFANLISQSLNKKLKYNLVHTKKMGNEPYYIMSPEKLILNGWVEPIDISQRIKETVDWYTANPNWLEG